jgi:prevent-host-death family protein
MARNVWHFTDAKHRFSEVVEAAMSRGPQIVTKNGDPAVVIVPVAEHQPFLTSRRSLVDALRACPEDLTVIVGER